MTKYLLIFLLIALVSTVRVFLFGSILSYDNNLAYRKLAEETGKPTREDCDQNWETTDCPKVAVITSACPDSQCGEEEYYIGDEQQAPTGEFFQKLGMAPAHVTVHIDNYEQTTDVLTEVGYHNLNLISAADIIYFNGGDQFRHMRCWFNDDDTPNAIFSILRRRVLNNQVILVGVSAGTAVQAKTTYGGGSSFGILYFSNLVGLAYNKVADGHGLDDVRNGTDCLQYQENGAKIDGFGFVTEFQIDTHFDRRGRLGRMIPVMVELKNQIGVGIDEQATLYFNNGVGTVFGQNGVFIADISNAYKVNNKYFQMKNIKIHYLTEGDSFDFKTKKVATSKPLITTPSFSGYADSNNLLSKYECTRLLTRLVDQKGMFNQGKTSTPQDEDYPISTPRFDIIFYKQAQTKGYKHNTHYTVDTAYMDISVQSRN